MTDIESLRKELADVRLQLAESDQERREWDAWAYALVEADGALARQRLSARIQELERYERTWQDWKSASAENAKRAEELAERLERARAELEETRQRLALAEAAAEPEEARADV